MKNYPKYYLINELNKYVCLINLITKDYYFTDSIDNATSFLSEKSASLCAMKLNNKKIKIFTNGEN